VIFLRGVLQLVATVKVGPSSLIVFTLMEAIRFSESSVLTKGTRRNIKEDGILHSQRHKNLKSYIALTRWAL
jgi:hypothetical protein